MQIYEGHVAPPGEGKIAIVVSKFNQTVTQSLLDGCIATLKQNSVREKDITVAWVPGAFELPTIAGVFADNDEYQAVICLGCIIKGETPHDTYIAQAVSQELARLGSETGIPVIFGVLTCNTNDQAMARAGLNPNTDEAAYEAHDKLLGEMVGNKGVEAAEAALAMLDLLIQIPEPEESGEDADESIFYNAKRYQAGDFDSVEEDDFEEDDDFEEELDDFSDRKPRKWDKTFKEAAERSFPKKDHKGKKPFAKESKSFKGGKSKGKSSFGHHSDSSKGRDKSSKGKGSRKSR